MKKIIWETSANWAGFSLDEVKEYTLDLENSLTREGYRIDCISIHRRSDVGEDCWESRVVHSRKEI